MSTEQQTDRLRNVVEDLINENAESSQVNFHEYLREKTRSMFVVENEDDMKDEECKDDDKKDEDDDKKDDDKKDDDKEDENEEKVDEGLNQPTEGAMSKKIHGKLKYKNGGKKTLKKHGNSSKCLDDGVKGKLDFKKGGKQPAKVLEKTPKPVKFNDGRDYGLGTT
jgi:hypothetical protein